MSNPEGATFRIPVKRSLWLPLGVDAGDLIAINYDDLRGIFRVESVYNGGRLVEVTQIEIPELSRDVMDLDELERRR